jgi:thiamine-phosphate pyrophosphorylase
MICLVTDRRRVSTAPDGGRGSTTNNDATDRLVELVASAAAAGVDLVQVRERDLDGRALLHLVERCIRAVDGTRTKVVVNDRADVALAAGAHGVHLRGDSIAAPQVRTLVSARAIVGRSVHSAREAAETARQGGVDYLIFGTMFETPSKDANPRLSSAAELAEACQAAAGIPVLAIGGISIDRAPLVRRAGAAGVAGIGLFIPPPGHDRDAHLHTVVSHLRRTFDTCEAVS